MMDKLWCWVEFRYAVGVARAVAGTAAMATIQRRRIDGRTECR